MSRVIDQKVVEMRFDNQNFEKNVKTSMSTLDKLKKALRLTDSGTALDGLEKKLNTINLGNLSNTISGIADKFSGLQLIGTMAIMKLANYAADAGIRIAKALSFDVIIAGWQKLQQKATAMSTLLSQGYETEVVEKQLEKLNWFSDETSYNFTDMIENIAKFTATGKTLEDSVTAMQGIALWAAKSGQNAAKASAAMYQLSQALGAGYMRREDWKSIQNYSMDTDEFRQTVLETAVALGKLKKVGENTYQSLTGDLKTFTKAQFAESLTEGMWFTSDVMMETYKKYANGAEQVKKLIDTMSEQHGIDMIATDVIKAYKAYNNLSKTGETFKDFVKSHSLTEDAAKDLEKMVSELDKFGMSAMQAGQEYRTWADVVDSTRDALSTKWMGIFETILGNIDQQKALWTTIGEKFYDWFAEPLNSLQARLAEWAEGGGRDLLFQAFGNLYKAIRALIKPIGLAFRDVFPHHTVEEFIEITKKFKDFTSHLILSEKSSENVRAAFRALFNVLRGGLHVVRLLIETFGKLLIIFRPLGHNILVSVEALAKFINKSVESARKAKILETALNKFVDGIKYFTESMKTFFKENLKFDKIVNIFKSLFNILAKIGGAIIKVAADIIRNGDLKKLIDIINGSLVATMLSGWMFDQDSTGIFDFLETILTNINKFVRRATKLLYNVKEILKAYTREVNARTLRTIAISVGILAASLVILSKVDPDRIGSALTAMLASMAALLGMFKLFIKMTEDAKKLKGVGKASMALIKMAVGLWVFAHAIKTIAGIGLGDTLVALIAMIAGLKAMIKALNSLPEKDVRKGSKALIKMSLALVVFGAAMKILASVPFLDLAKALGGAMVALKIMIVGLNKLNPEKAISKSFALLIAANSMIILAAALKILATMSWGDIARSLVAMGGALALLVAALNIIGGKQTSFALNKSGLAKSKTAGSIGKSFSLLIAANSLIVLAGALKILATMNWGDIGRSLVAMGGALALLVAAIKILSGNVGKSLGSAATLLIVANALVILALGLKILGSMSLASIGKGLLAIAGTFVVLGVAGALLSGVLPVILGLAGAAALFGIAAVAIGAGLALIATGITLLAVALAGGAGIIAAGITAIIIGFAEAIPRLIRIAGDMLVALAEVLIKSAPELAKSIVVFIYETIKALAEYTPMIVTQILDLIILTLRAVADRVPELIVSIAEVIEAIFKGFVEATKIVDPEALLAVVLSIGIIAVALNLMAGLASIIPAALIGVLAFGVLVAELSAVIAAIGNLSKIPGYELLISAGGNILMLVGEAIGKFIGGIVGGFSAGVSNSLPLIASNLSLFMKNLEGFLTGMDNVSLSIIGKTALLSGAILLLSAAGFISAILQLATIGSLPLMGLRLSLFMVACKGFIEGAKEITPNIGSGILYLSKAILTLSAANLINGIAKIAGIFTGGNSLEKFGFQISLLGLSLRAFVNNLGTFGDEEIKKVKTACEAIATFSKAAKDIPNSGGLKSLFEGDNDIATFGLKLPLVGLCLQGFALSLKGFGEKQMKAVNYAASSIVSMANAAKEIPNSGGLKVLLSGDNDIAVFGLKLPIVGACIRGFALELSGFTKSDMAAVEMGAKTIAVMAKAADKIPNSGGLKALFTGDNDIATFGTKLPLVGACLRGFSIAIGDLSDNQIKATRCASEMLAIMATATKDIPASFGLKQLFTGSNDISRFAFKLPFVGLYLKGFVLALGEFGKKQIESAKYASEALVTMAKATKDIPATGGIKQLFTGDNDISEFASKLPATASGLKDFADNLKDYDENNVKKAGLAAETIATMATAASKIPKTMGIKSLFTGDNDIAIFGAKLPLVGYCLQSFVDSLNGFVDKDVDLIKLASDAIVAMATAASKVPKTNIGLKALFEGDNDISKFAGKFESVGDGLSKYVKALGDEFDEKSVDKIKSASEALNAMTSMSKIDSKNLEKAIKEIPTIGEKVASFIDKLTDVSQYQVTVASANVAGFIELIKKFDEINGDNIKNVSDGIHGIADTAVKDLVKSLSGSSPRRDIGDAIRDLIDSLISNAEAKRKDISDKFVSLVTSAINAVSTKSMKDKMRDAGRMFAEGFANGIDDNKYLVTNAGTRLGNAAYDAARKAIDSHSPSKKAHKLGGYFGEGFAIGISEYGKTVYDESYNMGDRARSGLSKAISKINNILDGNVESQPIIRPVLDLSNIQSGAGTISSMFNDPILGNNLNAISVGMRNRSLTSANDDVISAINKLGTNLSGTGDTYNINGITYGSDSEIADAVRSLIRAANVERRI